MRTFLLTTVLSTGMLASAAVAQHRGADLYDYRTQDARDAAYQADLDAQRAFDAHRRADQRRARDARPARADAASRAEAHTTVIVQPVHHGRYHGPRYRPAPRPYYGPRYRPAPRPHYGPRYRPAPRPYCAPRYRAAPPPRWHGSRRGWHGPRRGWHGPRRGGVTVTTPEFGFYVR